MKIMVIEDEQLMLKAIQRKIGYMNWECLAFPSAEDAIDYINKTHDKPDAIWLDYHLKGMNGLEFVRVIKAMSDYASIPIQIVSNSMEDSTVKNVMSLGVNKYILKAEHRLDDIVKSFSELVGVHTNA